MKDLVFEIRNLCKKSHEGSFETQRKRMAVLTLATKQLTGELGYQHMNVRSLKPKHVDALVKLWQSQNLSTTTIKVRMSQLRWWAEKIHKKNVIARKNDHYGVKHRVYVNQGSKALVLTDEQINTIDDEYVRASVMMARAFGLRKEEAIKVIPSIANESDRLYLRPSWCKGGRERLIPIRNEQQREALENALIVAGNGSLIPPNLRYIQQRRHYEKVTLNLGMKRLHGLRHHYAQTRYRELTGWDCPHLGGPKKQELNDAEREIDLRARETLTSELGHNRIAVLVNYLG
ncbi:phage integrase N-terminal domain-containing protein [Teredinibacter haidensis]|uniref:phage integrase N-terminal domain-containing protein n=1 Tax=Teredinibacter haidensis TaxID=2731755 RepID=UPI000948BD36|nr:phage integrase N-terminal domain-containing protein [Teredinibacter haidensis]